VHNTLIIQGIARKHVGTSTGLSERPNVEEAQGPPGGSEVWQTVGLETHVFGSVAISGLTDKFSDVWQIKELRDKGQGTGVRPEKKSRDRRGCVAANTGTG
jgi:hypothetical protein